LKLKSHFDWIECRTDWSTGRRNGFYFRNDGVVRCGLNFPCKADGLLTVDLFSIVVAR